MLFRQQLPQSEFRILGGFFRYITPPVGYPVNMGIYIELKELDFTKRYRINGINYLISEISVTLNNSSIKSAQLKCFTAP